MQENSTCPCGGEAYAACCQPFHQGEHLPETAEQLMRSRFSAYALDLKAYIWETTHPRKQNLKLKQSIERPQGLSWIKLEILETSLGQSSDKQGKVRFKAHFQSPKKQSYFHEHSRFRRFNGRWYYWDGQFLD